MLESLEEWMTVPSVRCRYLELRTLTVRPTTHHPMSEPARRGASLSIHYTVKLKTTIHFTRRKLTISIGQITHLLPFALLSWNPVGFRQLVIILVVSIS